VSPKANTQSLMQVAILNAGIRKGYRACLYLVLWGIASDAEKRPMSANDLAKWWGDSRTITYKRQAIFREAFPGEETPERLWKVAQVVHADRSRQSEVMGQIVGTAWVAPS